MNSTDDFLGLNALANLLNKAEQSIPDALAAADALDKTASEMTDLARKIREATRPDTSAYGGFGDRVLVKVLRDDGQVQYGGT